MGHGHLSRWLLLRHNWRASGFWGLGGDFCLRRSQRLRGRFVVRPDFRKRKIRIDSVWHCADFPTGIDEVIEDHATLRIPLLEIDDPAITNIDLSDQLEKAIETKMTMRAASVTDATVAPDDDMC